MKVLIAGGGTGGHLFPALALAEAFKERDPRNEILFVGSRRGLEGSLVEKEGYALMTIDLASLKGKSWFQKIRALLVVPRSLIQAAGVLRSFRPDWVMGVGGYASGPVVLAAWALGYKTFLQEQNVFPGLSNRILGRFVERAFISFAESAGHFPAGKAILTGNPVRRRIRAEKRAAASHPFTLLIFGGSQGAHRLNQVMGATLPLLKDLQGKIRIIHQTGERDFPEFRETYQREGFEAEVHPFIYDMDRVYGQADLVLCRAGATTLFELMASGKPAILVPYPYAANDHQTLNAENLVRAGAALRVADGELSPEIVNRLLRELAADPRRLKEMGEKALALARPEAAREIVNLCYETAGHG
ncbi:MAG: murG [Deltaproteobacteria bacterium]|jgi:UDP-N-acetylglucosamine--N-acetylmuramyl-(pentapeptide) pyrophosphoryl-undecaprenol N-acetylglucosamine transferase|nr:murG [Deltaproteobacteria bacterium]